MFTQLDFNLNFHVMCTDALQLWARYNAVKVEQKYLQQTLPDPTWTRRLTTNEWYLTWPVQTKYQGSRPGPQWIITTIFVVGDWRSIRTTTALGCTSMMYEKRLCHLPDIRCDPVSNVRYTWEWIDTTWCVLMLWNHGLSTLPINSYNWYKITCVVSPCAGAQIEQCGSWFCPLWINLTFFGIGELKSIRAIIALGCTSLMYEKRFLSSSEHQVLLLQFLLLVGSFYP